MTARVLMRHAPHPRLVREIPEASSKEQHRQKTLEWLLKRQERKSEEQVALDEINDASSKAMAADTQAVCELCGLWLPKTQRTPHHPNFGSGT